MACRSSPTGKPPPTLQRQPHTANNTQAVSSPRQEGTEAAGSSWHLACLHQDSLSSDCSVFPCDVSEVTEIPEVPFVTTTSLKPQTAGALLLSRSQPVLQHALWQGPCIYPL